ETDTSLCDCVADLRAGTPSIAAERAFPLLTDWLEQIEDNKAAMDYIMRQMLDKLAQRTDRAGEGLAGIEYCLETARNKLALAAARLEQVSPLAPLSRGYALVTVGDVPIRTAKELAVGSTAVIRFERDVAEVVVGEIYPM
ncbi:MAG: hypothetical protein FWD16_05030, partial [Clostridia bacterium]|nr:hypothetical protein [Clostridia bacterium]